MQRFLLLVTIALIGMLISCNQPPRHDLVQIDDGQPTDVPAGDTGPVAWSSDPAPPAHEAVTQQYTPPAAPAVIATTAYMAPSPQPAMSASAAAAPSSPSGPRTYTIQRGDTLWSIATRYYGSGKRWTLIHDANPNLVPKKMRVGQRVVMP